MMKVAERLVKTTSARCWIRGFKMACVSLNVVFPGKMEKVQMLQGMGKSYRCFYPKKTVNGISRMVRKGSNISELKGIMELVVFIIDLKIT